MIGIVIRAYLPDPHLSEESRKVVTLGMGLVATMAALVLGLLVSGAYSNFRDQRSKLTEMSASIVFLDKLLANYGLEAKDVREDLRRSLVHTIDQFWPISGSKSIHLERDIDSGNVYIKILALNPNNNKQHSLRDEALAIAYNISQSYDLLVIEQLRSIPEAFLIALSLIVFWFFALFFSFGLYVPTNATVISTFILAALSITIAIFLIIELSTPFEGVIHMPSSPLTEALFRIGK